MEKKTVNKLIKTILILNIISFILILLLLIIESEMISILLGLMTWTMPILAVIILANLKSDK